jgi:Xaa-Pro aminopeptidase
MSAQLSHLTALRSLLEHEPYATLCLLSAESIFHLTGFATPSEPLTALLVTAASVRLVTRELERGNASACPADVGLAVDCYAEDEDPAAFVAARIPPGPVGMELSSRRVSPAEFVRLASLLPAPPLPSSVAAELRLVKGAGEVASMRRAALASHAAIEAGVRAASPRATETFVAGAVASALYVSGSEYAAHPVLLGSGERSAAAHCTPAPAPVAEDAPLFMEVGAASGRMHASTAPARAQRRERKDASGGRRLPCANSSVATLLSQLFHRNSSIATLPSQLFSRNSSLARRAGRMHTVWVGDEPPAWFVGAEKVLTDAIETGRHLVVDGAVAGEVTRALVELCESGLSTVPGMQEFNFTSRPIYSIGCGFPIDWHENEAFPVHPRSSAVIRAGMTFHVRSSIIRTTPTSSTNPRFARTQLLPWCTIPGVASIGWSTTILAKESGPADDLYPAKNSPYGRTVRTWVAAPKAERLGELGLACFEDVPALNCAPDAAAQAQVFHADAPRTPLVELKGDDVLNKGVGRVFIKDEGRRLDAMSFKALGASFALHKLQEDGQIESGTTVCSMTDGNHGAGLAYFARKMGLKCVIFVPENMAQDRLDKLYSLGADVRRPPAMYDDACRIMMEEAHKNDWCVVSDQSFLPDENWPDGYELIPTYIVRGRARQ